MCRCDAPRSADVAVSVLNLCEIVRGILVSSGWIQVGLRFVEAKNEILSW
jgi:hypothetical protein